MKAVGTSFDVTNKMKKIIMFFATAIYIGYVPVASGTISTLVVGIPLYLLFSELSPQGYIFATALFFVFSVFISHQAEIILQEKDSHKIVIDEFVGYLVAMSFIPANWKTIGLAFLLFRFFDILKVFPANVVEKKIQGGLGVVLDDVVAGIYANLILQAALFFAPVILSV